MALFGSLVGSALSSTTSLISGISSKIPASATLASSANKLLGGIGAAVDDQNLVSAVTITAPSKKAASNVDMRVRLRANIGKEDEVYGQAGSSNIMSILHDTNGVIFPFTPTISFSQDVDYKNIDLVHTNYDFNAYTRTPSASISVSGKFTVQNQLEGQYAVAVLHFLRTVSKMYFGEQDSDSGKGPAGLPPPTLLFSGYGTYMFNDLRVILKSHNYSFDDSVDMVDIVTLDGYKTRLPSVFTISATLAIQKAPAETRKTFSLDQFRNGELMRKGGWI